jgi:glycosyltransferase involved in cell wall biosynthesis
MKLSIAICTHNEGDYIRQLLTKLTNFIVQDLSGIQYEIVVVDDYSTDAETKKILGEFYDKTESRPFAINLYQHTLNGHYAEHKNHMNSLCNGDWILNLDADEWVSDDFLGFIPTLIDSNPEIEAYWIPRINTVEGLTLKHLQKWGWVLTKMEDHRKIRMINSSDDEYKLLKDFDFIIEEENGFVTYFEPIISWPDYQMRLYKNSSQIQWKNKVHEQLHGYKKFGMLPQETTLAIRHYKEISRQEQQNAYYETLV